jgi:hypothetical protein
MHSQLLALSGHIKLYTLPVFIVGENALGTHGYNVVVVPIPILDTMEI